jgi:hypothetical protein
MLADYAKYILEAVNARGSMLVPGTLLGYIFTSDTERTEWLIDNGLRLCMARGNNGTGSDSWVVIRDQCQPTSTSPIS